MHLPEAAIEVQIKGKIPPLCDPRHFITVCFKDRKRERERERRREAGREGRKEERKEGKKKSAWELCLKLRTQYKIRHRFSKSMS